jgi:hypothetical protein
MSDLYSDTLVKLENGVSNMGLKNERREQNITGFKKPTTSIFDHPLISKGMRYKKNIAFVLSYFILSIILYKMGVFTKKISGESKMRYISVFAYFALGAGSYYYLFFYM